MSLLTRFLQTLGGAAILTEWLGAGTKPVSQETADTRAIACCHGSLGSAPCPHNAAGDWYNNLTAEATALVLERQRAKFALNLRTERDSDLHFCSLCGCDLKTKIWTPLEHIVGPNPRPERFAVLPAHCWLRKEALAAAAQPAPCKETPPS